MGIWQLNVFHRKNLAKPETQGTSPSCSHILANARMFRSCGDTLFNDLSMFLSALSCTYILSIDIKPLKTLCRKGFACMGTLSAMESLSDALNVLFFALLSGEHYNIFTKVNAWYHKTSINNCIRVFRSISNIESYNFFFSKWLKTFVTWKNFLDLNL